MDQETVTQAPMEQDQLHLFTDTFQQLLRIRNSDPKLEDLLVTTIVPVTDLSVYPEQKKAPPSLEDDFFTSSFGNTMRVLLFYVPETVSQERIDNLHKCLKLPGKLTKLLEPGAKSVLDK
ncbi:hypothetical protein AYI70_g3394 [Smittium culicis]|uniref:Uncharacterized protein n=1 Tax=Smittium culicis TaxID=133412 RepID=A0A1R1Y414_9FUNG|nr:hypothetical protein AYI70_g3394 [Smittium culicis]